MLTFLSKRYDMKAFEAFPTFRVSLLEPMCLRKQLVIGLDGGEALVTEIVIPDFQGVHRNEQRPLGLLEMKFTYGSWKLTRHVKCFPLHIGAASRFIMCDGESEDLIDVGSPVYIIQTKTNLKNYVMDTLETMISSSSA